MSAPPSPSKALLLSRDGWHDDNQRELLGSAGVLAGVTQAESTWTPTCRSEVRCSRAAWLATMQQLVLHPELTSSSILRADISEESELAEATMAIPDFHLTRCTKRTLLPRRPNLDASLEQLCHTFVSSAADEALVLMTPLAITAPDDMPFYHPVLRSIAFHYRGAQPAYIDILVLPFAQHADFDAAASPQHRLSRTVVGLVTLQARIGLGKENGYEKRVEHDVVVPRDIYQHLYMHLRNRYAAQLIDTWVESTDVRKHLFEDLGIAAFIMLLWRDTFPALHENKANDDDDDDDDDDDSINAGWGRPAYFVDVGCGNGLLVYLLTAEGYRGYGVDVQQRKSWSVYRHLSNGRVDLRAEAVDAPGICLSSPRASTFPSGCFLIGNHADELTSWLPLLAHVTPLCEGLLNIPCCRFDLNGTAFGRSKYAIEADDVRELVGDAALERTMEQVARGPLAKPNSTSRNIAYLRHLSLLHLRAGWLLEKEALRIPSTKNWALVGRRRTWSAADAERSEEDVHTFVQQTATLAGAHWHARVSPAGKSCH